MPALPNLPLSKILAGMFLFVLAVGVGVGAGTLAYNLKGKGQSTNVSQPPSQSGSSQDSGGAQTAPASGSTQQNAGLQAKIPEGWQTYSNTTLGFKFNYPKDATLTEGDLRDKQIENAFIHPATYTYNVTLHFADDESLSISAAVGVFADYLPVDPHKDAQKVQSIINSFKEEETTLDGRKGYRLQGTDQLPLYFTITFGKDTSSEMSILAATQKHKEEIDQVISTFKFLE